MQPYTLAQYKLESGFSTWWPGNEYWIMNNVLQKAPGQDRAFHSLQLSFWIIMLLTINGVTIEHFNKYIFSLIHSWLSPSLKLAMVLMWTTLHLYKPLMTSTQDRPWSRNLLIQGRYIPHPPPPPILPPIPSPVTNFPPTSPWLN